MLHEKNVTGLKQISRRFWAEPAKKLDGSERSKEHASYIIESLETGRHYRGHFNIMNEGCITNLPWESVVEVPCYVDGNGISIPKVGDLPLGCCSSYAHNQSGYKSWQLKLQFMAMHSF